MGSGPARRSPRGAAHPGRPVAAGTRPGRRDLATLEGGYRLTVPRGGLDVCRFEDALAEAARADGEPALRLLDEAVGLCRGPALGELADRPFALATAARLKELRVAAAERQAELQLSLGRAEEAVAALGALLAEHPEREQARGLLMQALYRTGRQTEALATIRSWRRHLATELGLDPSPALQAIEQDILRHTAGTPDTRGAAAPALPLPVTSFVGRDEELVAVTARLGQARLVTLHGPGGVGKTRLAVEVAERTGGSLPGRSLFLRPGRGDRATRRGPGRGHRGRAQRARVPAPRRSARRAPGRQALLLVLDNCEHVAQAAAVLAERLLKQTRGVTLLATSRERLEVDGEHVWQVRPLPVGGHDAPGRSAVPGPGPRGRPGRRPAGPGHRRGRRALRQPGRPAAGHRTGRRAAARDHGQRAGREPAGQVRAADRRTARRRHRSLRAVVDWSYEQLSAGQQDLFGQLAVFHGSFDAAAARAVADGPGDPAAVTRLLLHLADRSLVTAELDGDTTRYRLLETLRGYGLERLAERGQLDAARARHARWAADLVAQAERGLRGADEASWAGTLERYFGDLRAAHGWLCGQDPELGLRMSAQLHWYALWRCHSEVYRWADASAAAAAGSRSPFYPEALASASFGAVYRGDLDAAGSAARSALAAARDWPRSVPGGRWRPSPRSPPSAVNWPLRWTCTSGRTTCR